ncbi:MAG: glycerophosphodiester phosphodiesterase family protein [Deferribacterales bacterium]
MRIIAHRGASYIAPENTLSAFSLALSQGSDGIELDVRLTQDGEIVALHDKNTRRTCRQAYDVSKTLYSRIASLDAGSWKSDIYAGERIPKLSEVLDILPVDRQVYIEIKCGKEITLPLCSLLRGYERLRDNIILFGFGYETIKHIKANMREYRALWIGEFGFNLKGAPYDKALDMVKSAGLDGFSTKADRVHCMHMRDRLKGMLMNVWTVDDTDDAGFFGSLGIDSLTTNRPDIMIPIKTVVKERSKIYT